jgi:predicted DCC family thiol-disulfide oxidoreductase YuxK
VNQADAAGATVAMDKPIIFFDGVCGMCNTFVDIILRADKAGTFLFAPLQGPTAARLLPPLPDDPREWSMIYLDERGAHDQSDASLEVYKRLGGAWKLLGAATIVPRALRTPVYRLIARSRYRLFGKRDVCRIPTPAERARFLD